MLFDLLVTIMQVAVAFSAFASFGSIVYDKVIAKPKLRIDADRAFTRLAYTSGSWAWAPRLKDVVEQCKPHGTVISIPVVNDGRRPAEGCKAKMRFRRRGDEWSRWFELHWADNLEDDVENAYRPQVIAPDEEAYIDLLVYHSRIPPKRDTKVVRHENWGIVDPGYTVNPCLLTFYAKPFLRGPLVRDPCEGEPPTIEYLKPPFNEVYEVEVLVKCTNASAKADLNLEITLSSEELSITLWQANTQKPALLYSHNIKQHIHTCILFE